MYLTSFWGKSVDKIYCKNGGVSSKSLIRNQIICTTCSGILALNHGSPLQANRATFWIMLNSLRTPLLRKLHSYSHPPEMEFPPVRK